MSGRELGRLQGQSLARALGSDGCLDGMALHWEGNYLICESKQLLRIPFGTLVRNIANDLL